MGVQHPTLLILFPISVINVILFNIIGYRSISCNHNLSIRPSDMLIASLLFPAFRSSQNKEMTRLQGCSHVLVFAMADFTIILWQ